jgi:hypothetical protein
MQTPPSRSGVPAPGTAGLRLARIDFWSQQVALHGYDLRNGSDFAAINNRRIARKLAIEQFIAAKAA